MAKSGTLVFSSQTVLKYLKTHWVLVGIVILATVLRTWDLQNRAILFGDAAQDLWSARTAVELRQLPLLGIASSVPRFKQGPVTVWLEMAIYVAAGRQLWWYSLVFAGISLAAVIGVYELMVTQVSLRSALLATALIAVSPLAVAHGRVPYHITPIPLMMVLFLYCLVRVARKNDAKLGKNWFWVGLGFAGLFQFELALVPLAALIPYVWWRWSRQLGVTLKTVSLSLVGLGVGLLPQLLFDLTHGFAQLGGFATWVVYRLVGNMGLVADGAHSFGATKLQTFAQAMYLYTSRIISVDQRLWSLIGAVVLLSCA